MGTLVTKCMHKLTWVHQKSKTHRVPLILRHIATLVRKTHHGKPCDSCVWKIDSFIIAKADQVLQ